MRKEIKSQVELIKHKQFKALTQGILNIISEQIPDLPAALSNKDASGDKISGMITGSVSVEDKNIKESKEKMEALKKVLQSSENIKRAARQ